MLHNTPLYISCEPPVNLADYHLLPIIVHAIFKGRTTEVKAWNIEDLNLNNPAQRDRAYSVLLVVNILVCIVNCLIKTNQTLFKSIYK